jgi:hypothetical protein
MEMLGSTKPLPVDDFDHGSSISNLIYLWEVTAGFFSRYKASPSHGHHKSTVISTTDSTTANQKSIPDPPRAIDHQTVDNLLVVVKYYRGRYENIDFSAVSTTATKDQTLPLPLDHLLCCVDQIHTLLCRGDSITM